MKIIGCIVAVETGKWKFQYLLDSLVIWFLVDHDYFVSVMIYVRLVISMFAINIAPRIDYRWVTHLY